MSAEVWEGAFGDSYHLRNQVNWLARVPFWDMVIKHTGARSFCEFGCGPGWNLSAIKRAQPDVAVYGNDINLQAVAIAQGCGLNVYQHNSRTCELTFTAGVLIHVPPAELAAFMARVVEQSCHWVLAIEYAADVETEIEYRGQKGLLWKRPYGKLYEAMGLKLVKTEFLTQDHGFDDCTAWLFEK